MAAGTELARAYVTILPDMSGVSRGIGSGLSSSAVMGEADSAGKSIGSRLMGGVTTALKGATVAVGALGIAVGGLAIKGGISRQLQIEDAESKLFSLGHTTEGVKTIMDDAMKSVKGTAYSMGDAATMAATAVAAGIKPGEELQKYLSLVGDAATVAGVSMGEMGQIFGKVQTQGRAYTMEINQLADRGIPIYQWLAEEYGVTALELRKMVSEGKVDAETYRKVIEDNIGGAALQMGTTTKGAFANMGAALSRVGVQLTQWFFPLLKDVFNAATRILDGVTATLKPFSEAFTEAFTAKAGPAIAAFGDRAVENVGKVAAAFTLFSTGDFTGQIRDALGIEEDAPLVGTLLRARAVALELKGGITAMFAAYRDGGDDVTSSGFAGVLERVGLGAREVTGGFTAMFAAFRDGEDEVTSSGFAGVLEGFGVVARNVSDEVAGGVTAMVAAFKDGGTDVTSSGIAGVLESLGLVARSLWDAIGPTLKEIGPLILTTAAAFSPFLIALDGIVPVLPVIGEALSGIAEAVGGALIAVLPVLAGAFVDIGVALSGAISALLPSLVTVLEAMAVSLVALTPALVLIIPLLAEMVVWAIELVTPILESKDAVLGIAIAFGAWKVAMAGLAAGRAVLAGYQAVMLGVAAATYGAAGANVVAGTSAKVYTALTKAQMVASRAAAAGQWLLNAAMTANPIGLIIAGIAALVAGLVWFFTQTDAGKAVVEATWSAIKVAISAVSEWFTGTLVPAMSAAWDAIAAGATWLYENAIKPVWDLISAAISIAWGIISPILSAYIAVWKFVGEVFWNVWSLVIQVAWMALVALFKAGWALLRDFVFTPISIAWSAVGAAFQWVWEKVISPAWSALQDGLSAGWAWIDRNVFSPIGTGVGAVGTAFGVAKDAVGTAWDAMKSAASSAWNWIRDNVFAPFATGIEAIGTAFGLVKDVVAAAWESISAAALVPVNFIIESVYTNGLKKLFDTVAEKLGLSQRLPVVNPIGQAPQTGSAVRTGGRSIAMWTGGVLPGYTPGRDVHEFSSPTGGRLSLSGGEAIMRPEFTRAMGGRAGIARLNAMFTGKGSSIDGQSFFLGGIWDSVKSAAGAAWDFTTDAASATANFMKDPVAGALKVFMGPIEERLKEIGGGQIGEIIAGAPRALVKGIVDSAKSIFGEPVTEDGAGKGTGGAANAMGYKAMGAALLAAVPSARITSDYRPGARTAVGTASYHGLGRAVDIAPNAAAFNWIAKNYGNSRELIHTPMGARQLYNGRSFSNFAPITKQMHYNHIHWAMKDGGVYPGAQVYDNGGWLPPGGVAVNLSDRPEPIFSADQWESIDKGESNSLAGRTLIVRVGAREFTGYVEDVADDRIDARQRELSGYRGYIG